MLKVFSPCNFTRTAIRELFKEVTSEGSNVSLLVMDSRAFESVSQMNYAAMVFAHEMPDARIMVIRNDRFLSQNGPLPCGVKFNEGLQAWRSAMVNIITSEASLDQSLECLNWYAGKGNVSAGQKRIITMMKQGWSVKMIASQLEISEKTVYSGVDRLKKSFSQPRLSGLYRLFSSWTN